MSLIGFVAFTLLLMPFCCLAFIGQFFSQILYGLKISWLSFIGYFMSTSKKKNKTVEQATEVDAVKALVRALSAQQKKVVKLEAAIQSNDRNSESLKNQIVSLKREKRQLAAKLEARERNNAELNDRVVCLEAEYRTKTQEILKLKVRITDMECPSSMKRY
jgi:predicted RNase H-like nuclease (RuvC/YqgF family)